MQDLRTEIRHALQAVTTLRARFRAGISDCEALSSDERESLCGDLEQLILLRVEVLNAFELMVRLDPKRSARLLLRLYLGRGVSPDTKFGGYEFELSTMVDDLVEFEGAEALAELVRSARFDPSKLDDPRVARSFSEALSCEPDELRQWYTASTTES